MAPTVNKQTTVHKNREDNNIDRRAQAILELDKLLAIACAPDYDGTITIAIPAKAGRLGRVKIGYNQHL